MNSSAALINSLVFSSITKVQSGDEDPINIGQKSWINLAFGITVMMAKPRER